MDTYERDLGRDCSFLRTLHSRTQGPLRSHRDAGQERELSRGRTGAAPPLRASQHERHVSAETARYVASHVEVKLRQSCQRVPGLPNTIREDPLCHALSV